jgi:hypothetical protein
MSASGGSISHSGGPNHARICSRVPDVPADRAVRQPRRGPLEDEPGGRYSRRSRTTAGANPSPLTFTLTVDRSDAVRILRNPEVTSNNEETPQRGRSP